MKNIKRIRGSKGLSQCEVANSLDVSQQAVAKWEAGEAMPRADKLPEIARVLDCEVSDLFEKER